jgi:7-cyano-7-deazaguanine synthase
MRATVDDRAAVVLLSGGLDSVTTLAIAAAQGLATHALSFAYGQRHAIELGCARRQAAKLGAVEHRVIDLSHLGALVSEATSLVDGSALNVPKDREVEGAEGIPSTYVPARNTLFLAYALAWAEVLQARRIFIGVNALDYSGYPDCRPEYIEAFAKMANLATKMGVEGSEPITIDTPLIALRKHEIIALGMTHGVDHADTVSCYDPTEDPAGPLACGRCDSCQLRKQGFARAGVSDPTRYR